MTSDADACAAVNVVAINESQVLCRNPETENMTRQDIKFRGFTRFDTVKTENDLVPDSSNRRLVLCSNYSDYLYFKMVKN